MIKYWNCFLFCIFLLLTGCVDSNDFAENSHTICVELTLATPTSVATRAMTEDNEHRIGDIQILLFDESDKLVASLPDSELELTKTDNSITTVKISLDQSYLGKSMQFVLLANMNGNFTSTLDLIPGRAKEDILKDLTFQQTAPWILDGTRLFPMYGIIPVTLSAGLPDQTVYMLRSLARIQFRVNGDSTHPAQGLVYHNTSTDQDEELFHMSSVHVYYTREGGYIAPLVSYTNADEHITAPSQPADFSQRIIDSPFAYTIDASEKNEYLRSIYIPENDNTNTRPVVMVLGGHYKGADKETFYKVEFKRAETDQIIDILRNYTYDFNIKDVTGGGENTPGEALSKDSELKVVVTPWAEVYLSDANMCMYELAVSKSMITSDYKGKDEVIDVTTTYGGVYPNGMHWKYDGADSNIGNEGNWFSVTETSTGLQIHINENASSTSHQGSFTITSGALTKRIFIAQAQLESSNCYMVPESGLHTLYALNMGNGPYGNVGDDGVSLSASLNAANSAVYNNDGTINESAVASCRLIWQSRPGLITHVGPEGYDTATHPNQTNILENGMLAYTVGAPLPGEVGGNAVIGIFDESGNCIWSWHIWVVWGYNSEERDLHFLTNGKRSGFYFQDLNLGALVNEQGNADSFGLLYQWGRKDPMRSTHDLQPTYSFVDTYGFTGEDTSDLPAYKNSNEWHNWSAGTNISDVITSVRNPMSLASNWGSGSSANAALWGNPYGSTEVSGTENKNSPNSARYNGTQVWNEGKKSIYDPCPVGYRVPSINGFYFGMEGMALTVRSKDNPSAQTYVYSYCDLDGVGTQSTGYWIYFFGQCKDYEQYRTWMPMTPYYANGDASKLISPMEGSEGFAYTWLNCTGGKGGSNSGQCVGWHPCNYHIHEYANYGAASKNGGTVRCVRETDPDIVSATLPDQVALLAGAWSNMDFDVETNMDYWVENNNLKYDWVSATKDPETGRITVVANQPNLSSEDRVAYIYVCLSNGDKKPVKVIQSGVSIGADEIKVGCGEGDSKSITFTIPDGGSLSLPFTEDSHFTYALTNSGQTYTITVTAKNANASPNDIIENGFYLNLSDGTNTTQMPIRVVQSKYTIGDGIITVPYWGNDANNRKGTTYFTPPGGSTPTLYVWDGSQYVIGVTDDRFDYTLQYGQYNVNGKRTSCWALTATCKYPNYGNQRQRTVQIDLNGSRFDVEVIQNAAAPIVTTSVSIANTGGGVKLKSNLPTTGADIDLGGGVKVKALDGFTWKLLDDESDSWSGVESSQYINPTSYDFGDQKLIVTTAAANFPGPERTTTLKFEFTQTATGETFVVEIPVIQAAGSPFKNELIQADKDSGKDVKITWADNWKTINSDTWHWTITNASAAPSWLNLTTTNSNNVNKQGDFVIGQTTEKNGTGKTRSFTAVIEFQKIGTSDEPITMTIPITQNK